MIISFIIPAYKASETLDTTLRSIFTPALPQDWKLDVLVADDGSPDGEKQREVTEKYTEVTYISHSPNQGKCAAMNLAVPHSCGEIVIMLDADDHLVDHWPATLAEILKTWPIEAPLCFSACRTHTGQSTVAEPNYNGPLHFEDLLNERHTGEYLPIFRGDDLRARKGYRDPEMPWGCEMWTYLGVTKEASAWISSEILRIYHYDRPGSVTHSRNQSHTASQIARCYDLVFEDFGDDYQTIAPTKYQQRRLRQAVYTALSGDRSKAWALWKKAASLSSLLESFAALTLIILGKAMTARLVSLAKSLGLIKRFG
ncbi:MAG: glycosyltransferase family 2 protein [Magnetovibrio sp.]|nr:glycosyltransferase family 2 protein [Magnetovibrio sp.]